MADTFVKIPKILVGTQAQVESEITTNDIGFATDIRFYNATETDTLLASKQPVGDYATNGALTSGLALKVAIAQGAENAGKILKIDDNGNVVVADESGGASLPILYHTWADHLLNDISWLRADTFSWHDGEMYKAAYNHLASDIDGKTLQSETVNGVVISYYLADDGHKICLPDQEDNISALYEATGVAWYYILDTENKQFKLPRSKHNKYADTVPVVGNGMTLGLTNGTNNAGLSVATGSNPARFVPISSGYGTDVGTDYTSTVVGQDKTFGVTTDPEKSGVIATQEQDTDQYKYLYFYVGNFTQGAIEQTAGITAETLSAKADTDLSNINASQSAKETIVGWGMPDYSAGVSFTPAVGTTFTAPSDGIALVYLRVTGGNGNLIFNGTKIGLFGGSNANHNNFSLPMNKGDTITITMNAGSPDNTIGNFYPLKGVN